MLATHLKSKPLTRFVLVQDSVKQNGTDILANLIYTHREFTRDAALVYCEFEFNRQMNGGACLQTAARHLFIDGLTPEEDEQDRTRFVALTRTACILVIDSLAHMVYKFGLKETYGMLHTAKRSLCVKQIIALLHTDLFGEDDEVFTCMEQLATFNLTLLPSYSLQLPRVSYLFKKSAGKVISEVEQYEIRNGMLVTKVLEKLDVNKLVVEGSTLPENLTTFKIGLSDKDKELRSKLVLPYLPKEEDPGESVGAIQYIFDEADDWDEEDPDDDLDI